jgi:hypothetical protein
MNQKKIAGALLALAFFVALAFLCARSLRESRAAACIVGEAEGESHAGKIILAHALLNRGNFKGVYGCTSKRVLLKEYTRSSWNQSRAIYRHARESHAQYDPAQGADHWCAVEAMPRCMKWLKNCEYKTTVENHVFYKCSKQ